MNQTKNNTTSHEYPNHPRIGVGAVVFKNKKVLLVQRGKEPARGMWAIPGGSVELGETLQQAAEREILEETGVIIRAGKPVFTFEAILRDDTGKIQYHYVIIDLSAQYISGAPQPADDADDARWVSPEELANLPLNPATRTLLEEKYGFGRQQR